MVVKDAENCYGRILEIFEAQKRHQTDDMSVIKAELCKLSLELCRIHACQGVILQMLTSDSAKYKASTAEAQGLSELDTSSADLHIKQSPERAFEQSRVLQSDTSEIQISQIDVLGEKQPNPVAESISFGENNDDSPLTQNLLPLDLDTDMADGLTTPVCADLCFAESEHNCHKDSTKVESDSRLPPPFKRKVSTTIQSLVAKSSRLLFPHPTSAVKSSAQTLFDDHLPHNAIVHKRILTCFGACVEGSAVNRLWRKFLLAIFGIEDDELCARKVGSAVIHPDSRFSRGKSLRRAIDEGYIVFACVRAGTLEKRNRTHG